MRHRLVYFEINRNRLRASDRFNTDRLILDVDYINPVALRLQRRENNTEPCQLDRYRLL